MPLLEPVTIRSIQISAERNRAVAWVKGGAVVGVRARGVCGLWVDGTRTDAVNAIATVKGGQRGQRPLSTTLPAEEVVRLIDPDELAETARPVFLDAAELKNRLATLCFVRLPIRPAAVDVLPAGVRSRDEAGTWWLQNWFPDNTAPTSRLVAAMQAAGVAVPAVTSMNISGQPEIVSQTEAEEFCRARGVRLFLWDERQNPDVRGSFPILQVNRRGVSLLRDGHVPSYIFAALLEGTAFQRAGALSPQYPPLVTHSPAQAAQLPVRVLYAEVRAALDRNVM
jgi:tRNA A37 threonylcarbamoyladenosine synthetase subunit TsaC/SUA5/YrdC